MSRHKPTRTRVFDDVTLIENSSDHDAVVRRIPIVATGATVTLWLRLMVWNMGGASFARVLAERRPGAVTNLGGDLNSVPSAPRVSRLRKITTGWHSHPTHGRGDALDQVLTFEAKGSGR